MNVEQLLDASKENSATNPPGIFAGVLCENQQPTTDASLIVIGASMGGPRAIEVILRSVGSAPRLPIAIVQHMPLGLTGALAERLNRLLPFPVREACDGMPLTPGTVVIGAAGKHFRVIRSSDGFAAALDEEPATAIHRPSVDVLFESAAVAAAHRTCAVLLTGLGEDGARGMVCLHQTGAHTIAQSESSCVAYDMPRAAVVRGAVREVLSLDSIGPRLTEFGKPKHNKENELNGGLS